MTTRRCDGRSLAVLMLLLLFGWVICVAAGGDGGGVGGNRGGGSGDGGVALSTRVVLAATGLQTIRAPFACNSDFCPDSRR